MLALTPTYGYIFGYGDLAYSLQTRTPATTLLQVGLQLSDYLLLVLGGLAPRARLNLLHRLAEELALFSYDFISSGVGIVGG